MAWGVGSKKPWWEAVGGTGLTGSREVVLSGRDSGGGVCPLVDGN